MVPGKVSKPRSRDARLIDCSFGYTFTCACKDPNPTVRPTECTQICIRIQSSNQFRSVAMVVDTETTASEEVSHYRDHLDGQYIRFVSL